MELRAREYDRRALLAEVEVPQDGPNAT